MKDLPGMQVRTQDKVRYYAFLIMTVMELTMMKNLSDGLERIHEKFFLP